MPTLSSKWQVRGNHDAHALQCVGVDGTESRMGLRVDMITSFAFEREQTHVHLHFLGANRQVTGSRYFLEAGGLRLMIDCGLFQERPFLSRNWEPCPVSPRDIDCMLLTHAHLDHCGLIPKLVKEGYKRSIFATAPSMELTRIVLEDSARIQEEDAEYKKKRHAREGRRGPVSEDALYTLDDARRA